MICVLENGDLSRSLSEGRFLISSPMMGTAACEATVLLAGALFAKWPRKRSGLRDASIGQWIWKRGPPNNHIFPAKLRFDSLPFAPRESLVCSKEGNVNSTAKSSLLKIGVLHDRKDGDGSDGHFQMCWVDKLLNSSCVAWFFSQVSWIGTMVVAIQFYFHPLTSPVKPAKQLGPNAAFIFSQLILMATNRWPTRARVSFWFDLEKALKPKSCRRRGQI